MPLNDRIKTSLEAHRDEFGRYDLDAVRAEIIPTLTKEESDELASQSLYKRIKEIATRAAASVMEAAAKARRAYEEPELFPDLDSGYALDSHIVKDTDALLQLDFLRVISIREQQLADDATKLDALRQAYAAAYPIWREHPDWTFGQCKSELRRRAKRDKRKRH